MPVSVSPVQKKKYAKKSVCPVRGVNNPGASQAQRESKPEIITRSLSLRKL